MFDLPQDILRKLLSTFNAAPERLTPSEAAIAQRIMWCSQCDGYWVKRIQRRPKRCPKCMSPAWDRPLINQMLHARPIPARTLDQPTSPEHRELPERSET